MKFGSAATKKVLKRAALKSKVYYKKHRALNTLDGLDHRHGEAESLRRSSRARVVNNKRGIAYYQQRQTLNGSAQQTKKRGQGSFWYRLKAHISAGESHVGKFGGSIIEL